jgi:hypothetical protein
MHWLPIATAPPGDARLLLFVPTHGFEANLVVTGFRFQTRDIRGVPCAYWMSANGGPVTPTHWAPRSILPVPKTDAQLKEPVTA